MSSSGSTCNVTSSFDSNSGKYNVIFDGKTIETTVTDKAAIANEWANQMFSVYGVEEERTTVGLDIKWSPSLVPNSSNKTATLQLCIDDDCLIVQLLYLDELPQILQAFLSNNKFVFAGVKIAKYIRKLKDEYSLVCNPNFSDLSDRYNSGVSSLGLDPPDCPLGLKELASVVCHLDISKPKHVRMSNWGARDLSDGQIQYACIDAYASYKISKQLDLSDQAIENLMNL